MFRGTSSPAAGGTAPIIGTTLNLGFRAIASGTTDTANLGSDYTISWQSAGAVKAETIAGAAAGNKGIILNIVDGNGTASGTNTITITPTSGTINNAATLVITTAHGAFTIQSDGVSNWVVI